MSAFLRLTLQPWLCRLSGCSRPIARGAQGHLLTQASDPRRFGHFCGWASRPLCASLCSLSWSHDKGAWSVRRIVRRRERPPMKLPRTTAQHDKPPPVEFASALALAPYRGYDATPSGGSRLHARSPAATIRRPLPASIGTSAMPVRGSLRTGLRDAPIRF